MSKAPAALASLRKATSALLHAAFDVEDTLDPDNAEVDAFITERVDALSERLRADLHKLVELRQVRMPRRRK